jgi:hypothetical protein
MSDPTIQKLKTPGDYPIEDQALIVMFKAGPGVTRALLPIAKTCVSRQIVAVRATENTSPTIVNLVAATGDDVIHVGGKFVKEIQLVEYNDQASLVAIGPGAWRVRE